MKVGSLFSGIGGIELGLERAGDFKPVWFVECDKYAQAVLRKHWRGVPIHNDITTINWNEVERPDMLTGGFPCQDISNAGKRTGIKGERSGLWSYFHEAIGILRPRIVLIENVSALLNRGLNTVLSDIASLGYDAEWDCIPAAAVGAPHRRDRIFIIAYLPNNNSIASEERRADNDDASLGSKWGDGQRGSGSDDSGQSRTEPNEKDVPDTSGIRLDAKHNSERKTDGERESNKEESARGGCWSELSSNGKLENVPDSNSQRCELCRPKTRPCTQYITRCSSQLRTFRSRSEQNWAVEPNVGGRSYGFPLWIYNHTGGGLNYEESQRAANLLRKLWTEALAKKIWQAIGGLDRIQKAEVLLAIMRKYEGRVDEARLQLESEEALEKAVRSLWNDGKITGSSQRPKHKKQRQEEHPDSVQELSRLLALDVPTNWQVSNWEASIPRIAQGVKNRVDRIKCLGNAVVPQVAEYLGQRIIEKVKR